MVKNPSANAGDVGLIPGSGRSPGERNGTQMQYSCPENPDGQRSLVSYSHGAAKSQTQLKRLSMHAHVTEPPRGLNGKIQGDVSLNLLLWFPFLDHLYPSTPPLPLYIVVAGGERKE